MTRLNWILIAAVAALTAALVGTVLYFRHSELALKERLLEDKEAVLAEKTALLGEKTVLLAEKDTLLLRIQGNLERIRRLETQGELESQAEVARLQDENARFGRQLQRQQGRVLELQSQIDRRERRLLALNERIGNLETALEQKDTELSAQSDQISVLSEQVATLNGKLNRYEAADQVKMVCLDEEDNSINGTLSSGDSRRMRYLTLSVSSLPDGYLPSTLDVVVGYVADNDLNGKAFERVFHGGLEQGGDSTFQTLIPIDRFYKQGYYRVRVENAAKEPVGRDYLIDFQY